ncbi:MAG: hypothetical protein AUI93_06895 [Crenarchaeota archaeon 13_1_40CM_3_52_10]|nr:MAG: hypothetical protein AUI93_06895 [Crenarchaeota archaeon 13_1_40CM_3_52_10]
MSAVSFDDLVSQSVSETMSKILGATTWKSVNFFFDTKTAAREPEAFAALLEKVFGLTSKVLQKKIAETLLNKVGAVQPSNATDFRQILRLAKAKFPRTTVPGQIGS